MGTLAGQITEVGTTGRSSNRGYNGAGKTGARPVDGSDVAAW